MTPSQDSGEVTGVGGSSEIGIFKYEIGEEKNGRTKENISDSQICEETKNKEKDIHTGNTGTVQTVNPKNQFPFPGCLLYIRLTEEQKVLPTYSNVKIKPGTVAHTYDFSM